jgi:hypothetical protein
MFRSTIIRGRPGDTATINGGFEAVKLSLIYMLPESQEPQMQVARVYS